MSTIITVALAREGFLSTSHHSKVSDAVSEFPCPIKTGGITGLKNNQSNSFVENSYESTSNSSVDCSSVCFVDIEENCGSITVFGPEHQEVMKEIFFRLEDQDFLVIKNKTF